MAPPRTRSLASRLAASTGESLRQPPDFWTPFGTNDAAPPSGYDEHHTWWLGLIGRLKPGVTMAQASVDINARLQEFLHSVNWEAGSTLSPQRRDEIAHTTIALARGDLGRSSIRARAITPLTLLVVLAVLLLVAASANVATLLVARATARDRVTAIHLMLGASRARVVRLALAETLTIASPGLAAGVAIALVSPRVLLPLVTTALIPIDLAPDARLIAMVAAAVVVAAVVACAGPAWMALMAGGRHVGRPLRFGGGWPWQRADLSGCRCGPTCPPSHRTGRALVVVQMGLAVPLLIVAGLLIRSVDRLEGQALAVDRGHVLLVEFGPSLEAIPGRTAAAIRGDLLDRVREQPHVVDATFATQTPLGGSVHGSSLRVEGRPPRDDSSAVAAFVGPDYFHTVGIPLSPAVISAPRTMPRIRP